MALRKIITRSSLDRWTWFGVGLTLCGLLLLGGTAATVVAAPPAQTAQEGATIFQQRCASCHSIGGGRLVGPDLQGVSQRRDQQWLVGYITNPAQLRESGDPAAVALTKEFGGIMPSTGVNEVQARAVLAHIDAQSQGAAAVQTPPTAGGAQPPAQQPSASAGNAASGASLFAGTTGFQNGGPSCLSCHSNAGVGQLGGGTLGPDLTQVVGRLGATGLASVLNQIAFPTMIPAYAAHPLTPQEQADLVAFSEATASQPPVSNVLPIIGLSLALLAVFALVVYLVGRRRLDYVRRGLVASQRRRLRA